ncbi:MAG: hypothetical protein HQL72_12195 [Magnetococcales bacterium]|nr:hypothetical protein [Magnetococcales bacterium]
MKLKITKSTNYQNLKCPARRPGDKLSQAAGVALIHIGGGEIIDTPVFILQGASNWETEEGDRLLIQTGDRLVLLGNVPGVLGIATDENEAGEIFRNNNHWIKDLWEKSGGVVNSRTTVNGIPVVGAVADYFTELVELSHSTVIPVVWSGTA